MIVKILKLSLNEIVVYRFFGERQRCVHMIMSKWIGLCFRNSLLFVLDWRLPFSSVVPYFLLLLLLSCFLFLLFFFFGGGWGGGGGGGSARFRECAYVDACVLDVSINKSVITVYGTMKHQSLCLN